MLLTHLIAYSQQTALNKDTISEKVCFTLPQAKFLLKTSNNLHTCEELNSINLRQISLQDSTIKAQEAQINDKTTMYNNEQSKVKILDYQVSNLNLQLSEQKNKTLGQKILKFVFIGTTILSVSYTGYYVFTH